MLKPCPFCGGYPFITTRPAKGAGGGYGSLHPAGIYPSEMAMQCCGIEITAMSESLWNTRAKVTRLIIDVEGGYVCESST